MLVGAALLWLVLLCAPASAGAQMSVTAARALAFGDLVPGLVESISPDDTWRRGEVRLDGTGTFEIRLFLPLEMQAASGARIPLGFGPASARADIMKSNKPIYFDPAVGTSLRIPPGQLGAWIYLGSEARPATGQAAGTYNASVVVVVTRTDT